LVNRAMARRFYPGVVFDPHERLRSLPEIVLDPQEGGRVSELAVVPVQDLLGLGGEARMNLPSTPEGNWSWRLRGGELDAGLAGRFRRLVELSGRLEEESTA